MDPQLELLFRTTKQLTQIPQVAWVSFALDSIYTGKDKRQSLLLIQVLLVDAPRDSVEAEFPMEEYLDEQLQLFVYDVTQWLDDPVNKPCPTTPAALAASCPRWAQVVAMHP